MNGKRQGTETRTEQSSPTCLAHEAGDGYAGYLERDELIGFLNQLLEAERAGAKASAAYRQEAADPRVVELLEKIGSDEEEFCALLSDLVRRLGGEPTEATGHFVKRAVLVEKLSDRLALLSHGQGWVVDRICEVLPRVRDDAVHARLKEIAAAHEQNKAHCDGLIGPQQATS